MDLGGGAGLPLVDLGGLACSLVGVCAAARASRGEESGCGERVRLGCGEINGIESSDGVGGNSTGGGGWGVRERPEVDVVAGTGERIEGAGERDEAEGGVGVIRRGAALARDDISADCLVIGSAWNVNGGGVLSLGLATSNSSRRKRKSRPYSCKSCIQF